jgi:hypothetical protein
MALTVLDPQCYYEYDSFRQFFDLNGDDYIFYSDKNHNEPVDILVCNHFYHPSLNAHEIIKKYKYRCSIIIDTKHGYANQFADIFANINGSLHDYTITIAVQPGTSHPSILFFDFLFNRTKAYYLGYEWHPETSKNLYGGAGAYVIPVHPPADNKTKIFVAPSNPWNNQHYRLKLANIIQEKYLDRGYLGARTVDKKLKLHAQRDVPLAKSVTDLINFHPYHPSWPGLDGGYRPPHSLYYENTFISIYAETIEYGSSIIVSEKTFDPLIKGHFIFPFSNAGFISHIKNFYGFKFPEFIDYSYDSIADDDQRFASYANELNRLMNLSNWAELWAANYEIIKHNQQIFFDRPYHKIDFRPLLS